MDDQTFTFDQPQALTLVTVGINIIYPNMEFKGWATTPEGNVDYTNGQEININLSTTDNDTVTLYAVWPKDITKCTFTLSQDTYTYNGSACKPTVTVSKDNVTLVKDYDYTVAYSNNTDAGSATVTITGKDLYGGIKDLSFTINPVSVTVTWSEDPVDGYTYNGAEQTTPTASFIINNVNVPLDLTVKKDNGNGQYNDAEFREAGTYKISAEMKQNYITESSLEKIVTIEKAELEFVWSSVSYNGAPVQLGTDYTINGKYGSDTVYAKVDEYDKPITEYNPKTNSGTYNFVVTLDGDYKDNYTGVGKITITPIYVTINWSNAGWTLDGDNYTRVYDGTSTTITASYHLGSGDIPLTVKQNDVTITSIKDAGTYNLNVYGSIEDENVQLDSTPGNGSQTYIITKKEVIVVWEDYDVLSECIEKTFTGGMIKPQYSFNGIIEPDSFTISGTVPGRIAVGSYDISITPLAGNGTEANNYYFTGTHTTLVINPMELEVSWDDCVITYDGTSVLNPKCVFVNDLRTSYDKNKSELKVELYLGNNKLENAPFKAGTYTAVAVLTGTAAGNYVIKESTRTQVCQITEP